MACPLTADRAARRTEQRAGPRRLASLRGPPCRARRSPLRRRSRHSAGPLKADRPTHQPGQRRTRPAILSTAATNPRHGATFRRRSGATSGYATVDAAVIAIRSPGDAAPLPICCRSTTCCQSPRAVARSRPTWLLRCFAHHRMRHGYGPAAAAGTPDVAPPARGWRAARLRWPTACRWPGGDTLRRPASPACIFAIASSDPGRSHPTRRSRTFDAD